MPSGGAACRRMRGMNIRSNTAPIDHRPDAGRVADSAGPMVAPYANRIKELPESERPREKLEALGPGACSDAELIAILLRTGRQGASAVDIGRDLLRHFGSLEALKRTSVTQLAEVLGIGPAKAVQLAAAFALGDRLARESLQRERMDTAGKVVQLLGAEMRGLDKESLRVLLLDRRLGLLRVEEISRGSASETIAHPREILRPAVIHNAHAFILVHNHPSGDPTPSSADTRTTVALRDAARQLIIEFHDHIILGAPRKGGPAYYSFRENGLLGK